MQEHQTIELINKFHISAGLPIKGDVVCPSSLFGDSSANDLIKETRYHMAKLNKAMREVERTDSQEAKDEVERLALSIVHYLAKSVTKFGK